MDDNIERDVILVNDDRNNEQQNIHGPGNECQVLFDNCSVTEVAINMRQAFDHVECSIEMGEVSEEWEREMKRNQFDCHSSWAKHLLETHRQYCEECNRLTDTNDQSDGGNLIEVQQDTNHTVHETMNNGVGLSMCSPENEKDCSSCKEKINEALTGKSKMITRQSKNYKEEPQNYDTGWAGDDSRFQNERPSVEGNDITQLKKRKRSKKGQKKSSKQSKKSRKQMAPVDVCEKEAGRDNISDVGFEVSIERANDCILPCYKVEGSEMQEESDPNYEFYADEGSENETNNYGEQNSDDISQSTELEQLTTVKTKKKRHFKCNVCKATFPTSSEKNAHAKIHMNNADEKRLVCETCSAVFNSEISLKNHRRMHANKKEASNADSDVKCPECPFFGTRRTSLKRHMLLKHDRDLDSTPKSHICEHCKRGYYSKISLRKHLVKVHNVKELGPELVCEQCGERFFCAWELRKHSKYHKERDTPCTYEGCSSKFRSQSELNEHIRNIHIRGRSYKCTYEGCEWSFYRSNALRSHINSIHLQLRKHKCEWPGCDKVFKSQKNLSVHERIHKGQKPIKCDHCDFHCRQRTSLVYHLRKHGIYLESEDKRGKHWVPSGKLADIEEANVEQAAPLAGSFDTIKVQRTLKCLRHSESTSASHSTTTPSKETNVTIPFWNSDYSGSVQLQPSMKRFMPTDPSTNIETFIEDIIDCFDNKKNTS